MSTDDRIRLEAIKSHGELARNASKAYRKGDVGIANLYAEQAEMLLEAFALDKEDSPDTRVVDPHLREITHDKAG